MPRDDRLGGGAREWRLTDQHLVDHTREAVLVAAAVDLAAPARLLGTHVRGCADQRAGLREVVALSGRGYRARDPEVRDHGRTPRQHDVLRFDIPVHDGMAVGVGERPRYLVGHPQRVLERQLLLAREPVTQRLTFDVRHHVIEEACRRAGVVEGQDVRVLQAGGDLDFPEKPLGAEGRGELRVQYFDRHRPAVFSVFREEHRRHAAAPELALDRVAVGERVTKRIQGLGHGTA